MSTLIASVRDAIVIVIQVEFVHTSIAIVIYCHTIADWACIVDIEYSIAIVILVLGRVGASIAVTV
jgi:hypothetical protein